MVSGILSAQAGNTQMQVATSILKSNSDAEKFAVQTLLGGQASPSTANLGAGEDLILTRLRSSRL